MLDYIQREGFTELIISTPGPVGADRAARGARCSGCARAASITPIFRNTSASLRTTALLETLTWNYMRWFYEQLDLFYVN